PSAYSLVSHGLVLAGLIWAMLTRFESGISALATLELKGPTMPRTWVLEVSCWTFWAPFWGSWTPLTASSRETTPILNPLIVPFFLTAYWTPFRVGTPLEASEPDMGRSTPMSSSPLLPPPPPELLVPPQAKAARAAA